MFSFLKKKDRLFERANILCNDITSAFAKRKTAVETLVMSRHNRDFYKMTQAVFDDAYDLIDFETVLNKYVDYFKDETSLSEDKIAGLLRDVYNAGRENRKTNERVDMLIRNKMV